MAKEREDGRVVARERGHGARPLVWRLVGKEEVGSREPSTPTQMVGDIKECVGGAARSDIRRRSAV